MEQVDPHVERTAETPQTVFKPVLEGFYLMVGQMEGPRERDVEGSLEGESVERGQVGLPELGDCGHDSLHVVYLDPYLAWEHSLHRHPFTHFPQTLRQRQSLHHRSLFLLRRILYQASLH